MGIYKFSAASGFGNKTRYGDMLAGNTAFANLLGAYESIASYTIGAGGSSSVTFSSIPQTYTHLQLRVLARSNYNNTFSGMLNRYNGDSGTNYTFHALYSQGSNALAYSATGATSATISGLAANTQTANTFGVGIIDILDYTNTNKYKTTKMFGGTINVGGFEIDVDSSLWLNTAAITSINCAMSGTMQQHTTISLYGVKG